MSDRPCRRYGGSGKARARGAQPAKKAGGIDLAHDLGALDFRVQEVRGDQPAVPDLALRYAAGDVVQDYDDGVSAHALHPVALAIVQIRASFVMMSSVLPLS
jgi:hypothetical protein